MNGLYNIANILIVQTQFCWWHYWYIKILRWIKYSYTVFKIVWTAPRYHNWLGEGGGGGGGISINLLRLLKTLTDRQIWPYIMLIATFQWLISGCNNEKSRDAGRCFPSSKAEATWVERMDFTDAQFTIMSLDYIRLNRLLIIKNISASIWTKYHEIC